MIIEIIGWILSWLLIGFVTQLAIRVVRGGDIAEGPEYYFWSAMMGPIVPLLWALVPLFEWYEDLNKPGDHE